MFKLRLGPGFLSMFHLKVAFVKKETRIAKTNILINTPLIFLYPENRNILIVLPTTIPKLNDTKNIDIVAKCYKRMILHQKQYRYQNKIFCYN